MLALAVTPISSWFVISGFTGANVRMSLVKFTIRTTTIVYEQLLINNPTNDFWPITISRWY